MAAVTVVITSYNQGPLIREAVESALSQTVRPERIIIVDDGSDEQTSVDVLSAILDDCRHGALDTGGVAVDFIDQVNAGPSAARNRGIAAAGTPFVVVLDGDDRLMPTFVVFRFQSPLQHRQKEIPILKAAAHRLVISAATLPRRAANHACCRATVMRHERSRVATGRLDH